MSIKIVICETLAALVAAKADLKAPPINAVVLYQTAGAQGETGNLKFQDTKINPQDELEYGAAQTATTYAGKFILVVKN
jgi:hypothetical protein